MKIFLIGFMGCGKSTMGRKFASRLNYTFVDLDDQFEKQEGMKIAEYFKQYGEAAFRQREANVLKLGNYPENCIISTGGGLPCFFDNIEWMKANGKVVYIKLPPKTLAGRLENGKDERPLLHGKHGEEMVAFIAGKLAEREPYYLQANVIAEGLSLTPEKLEAILLNN